MKVDDETLLDFYALFLCKFYYDSYKTFSADKITNMIKNGKEHLFSPKMQEQ